MKLVSYLKDEHDQLAVLVNGRVYDMERLHPDLPNTMGMFLNYWEDSLPMAQGGVMMIEEGRIDESRGIRWIRCSCWRPYRFLHPAAMDTLFGST